MTPQQIETAREIYQELQKILANPDITPSQLAQAEQLYIKTAKTVTGLMEHGLKELKK